MMANCCTGTPVDLGCIGNCSNVDLGILAPQTGTYTIELVPGGGLFQFTLAVTDQFSFTTQNFREDACSIFQIRLPDNTFYSSGGNDCFKVEVLATGALSTSTNSFCDYELEDGGLNA